ncbi:hypothetical protein [Desulfitobacterium chlororespirans]|uniref:hypothetical protein n=1 Tax=Desulfitobacterium chlororespirans TaxID=51616 RepID=UPI001FA84001|nr:hypothetical protein [Desulfitobacterium chlororespirans]
MDECQSTVSHGAWIFYFIDKVSIGDRFIYIDLTKKWIKQPFKSWHDICIKKREGKERYRDGGCFSISSSVEKILKVEEVRRQLKSMFKPHKCER